MGFLGLILHFWLITKQLTAGSPNPSAFHHHLIWAMVQQWGDMAEASRHFSTIPGLPCDAPYTNAFEFQEVKASVKSSFLLDVGTKGWGVIHSCNKHLFFCFCRFTRELSLTGFYFLERVLLFIFVLPGQCLAANITMQAGDHGMKKTLTDTPSRVFPTFDLAIQAPFYVSYLFCSCEKRLKDRQKKLREERVHFGGQFKGSIYHGGAFIAQRA